MRRRIDLFFALLILSSLAASSFGQTRVRWTTSFDGGLGPSEVHDIAGPVAVGADGSIFQAGDSGNAHTVVTKRATNGVLTWARFEPLSVPFQTSPVAIAATPSGGVVVSAVVEHPFGTDTLLRLLYCYDSNGVLAWNREDGMLGSFGLALTFAPNGDLLVAGQNEFAFSVERIDSSGVTLWEYALPAQPPHTRAVASALAMNSSGDIWASGWSDTVAHNQHPLIVRLGADGSVRWQREIQRPGSFANLVLDKHDQAFVIGLSDDLNFNDYSTDWALLGFDAQGSITWTRGFPQTVLPSFGWPPSLALDDFGRIVALSRTEHPNGWGDLALTIVSTQGQLLASRIWDGGTAYGDSPQAVTFTRSGEIVVHTLVQTATELVPTLVAFDLVGNLRWTWAEGNGSFAPGSPILLASTPDGGLVVSSTSPNQPVVGTNLRLTVVDRTTRVYCSGAVVQCPCANQSPAFDFSGCLNSGASGGRLVDEGASQLTTDTFALVGSNMLDGPALYLQGTSAVSVPFGDGATCIGGSIQRLGIKSNVNGESRFPALGDPSISQVGLITPGERMYQVWYRDSAQYCTGAAFNTTNALNVTWY